MSAVGGVVARRARVSLVLAAISALFGLSAAPAIAASTSTISVVVPIVAPLTSNDLLTADELVAATVSGAPWAVLAHAALSHGATIALDSRIVASIDALGTEAPPTVLAWYSSIQQRRPLYLAWGNADPFVLSAIGPSHRVSAADLGAISGIPVADIVVWPTGHAGSDHSVRRAGNAGFLTFIVDDRAFPDAAGALNHKLSADIAQAVDPDATVDPAELGSHLRRTVTGRAIVTLPRDPDALSAQRAQEFLDALFPRGTVATRFFPTPIDSLGAFSFADVPDSAIRSLMAQHRLDNIVSGIAADPTVISTPRLRRLCVVAGRVDRDDFPSTVRSYNRSAKSFDEFVSFSLGSDFTVLANSTELPLTVTNTSSTDITVTASVNATSGIVNIAEPNQAVTIPAGESAQITIPMSSVANGHTTLRATLTTASGVAISKTEFVEIEVQAQWEGVTLIAFVGIVALIMGIGIARTIRDRRSRA